MHRRLLGWLLIGVLLTAFTARAQTPPAVPPVAGKGKFTENGVILVAKFSGKVDIVVDGVAKQAAIDMPVPAKARVVTGQGASVVLVFSNGASTQLGSDTDLVIEEFLQDPFASTIKVAEMTGEPSPSRTKLKLNKGELVGNVKKLKYDQDSSFTIQTPVGAAGIRGTTFRIVFRPTTNGQAFFTLTTATGQVEFTQPNQNTGTQTGTGTGGAQPTTTSTTETTGSGTAAVQVPQGQELVIIDVQVTTNAQGQMVVVAMPQTPTSTSGAGAGNMDAVVKVAQDIAIATQNATFSSPPPSNPGTGGTGGSNPAGTGGDGGGTTGTTGTTTTGTTTTTSTGTTTTTQTSSISGDTFTGSTTTTTTTTTNNPTTPPAPATRPSTIPSGP